MIKKIVKTEYINENGFSFEFEPIEDTLKIKKTAKGFEARYLTPDSDYDSPREWDNLGEMICFHSKYTLGDKHDFKEPSEFEQHIKNKKVVILPLFLYDHSGIAISATREYPFNDRWDSMQVGYIYADYETIRKELGIKHVTKRVLGRVKKILLQEVKMYNDCLTGQVFGMVTEFYNKRKEKTTNDSVWGGYGKEELLKEMEAM